MAIGIIATPAAVAQEIADRLVAAGITSVLNFAPSVVNVPDGASLRKVDLASELQILSFYQQRRSAAARRFRPGGQRWSGRPLAHGGPGAAPTARDDALIDEPLYPRAPAPGRATLPGGGGRSRGGPQGARPGRVRRPASPWSPPRSATSWPTRSTGVDLRAAALPARRGGRLPAGHHRHRAIPRSTSRSTATASGSACWVNSADDPDHCRVHPAGRGPPGAAAGHLLHQRAEPGAGLLAAAPLRRRAGPGVPGAARAVGRASGPAAARTRVVPPRALIGNRLSTRECWSSSARATSPKPRSASRRVCRRHRAEPPHRAARPARADDHRRVAPAARPSTTWPSAST